MWSDYWGALRPRHRVGLIAGMAAICVAAVCLGVWLLRDPYTPLAGNLSAERLNELTRELDRAKVPYQITVNADGVAVPRSQLGKARAATEGSAFGVPPSVGLELFKDVDFSTTDFAQRINYQRALQGELTRTIQTIAGVRSVRVHVILADTGLFKRNAAKASAAVTLAMQPEKVLGPSQVRGIQRLVAASVPEIRIDDVVVLNESGTSLTRAGGDAEGDMSSGQLDIKRQADEYLQNKLARLLQDLIPKGTVSISVDTVLDEKQLRVTTDEPVGIRGAKDGERATGILIKDHLSQHGHGAGGAPAGVEDVEGDSSDSDHEYMVGHRTEQTLSASGSIKRVSVAVALQGAPPELSSTEVEKLVINAVGIDRSRGDSLTVLMLPLQELAVPTKPSATMVSPEQPLEAASAVGEEAHQASAIGAGSYSTARLSVILSALVLLAVLIGVLLWRARSPAHSAATRPRVDTGADLDLDAVTVKVRQWLQEGANNGRA